jgi:S-formylglutathione hydrolase FrmB
MRDITARSIAAVFAGTFAIATLAGSPVGAQTNGGRIENVVVHGASLERNMMGISADRAVSVYLPPSYSTSTRRYPVLYVLHGIMDSPTAWTEPWPAPSPPHPGYATIQELMDRGIANGTIQEMIVVIPDAEKSCHYTDSPVKGKWGTFIANDLVAHIDRTYRTSANPSARGLMGHSMGGHGAIKIAMTHPGVFSVVYGMNPSMLGWGGDLSVNNPQLAGIATVRTPADIERANFYVQAVIGVGQCFSPNPNSALLTDAPFAVGSDGSVQPTPAEARWTAQMPVYMAPRFAPQLKALRGLGFDSAFEDEFTHIPISSKAFAKVLDSLGVPHTFEMYDGDHRNRLWGERGRLYTVVLPFFSRLLRATSQTSMSTPLRVAER